MPSKHTKRLYNTIKREYLSVVNKPVFNEDSTTKEDIQKYAEHIKQLGNTASTMHNKLRVLSALFEDLLTDTPNFFKVVKRRLPRAKSIRPTMAVPHNKVSEIIHSFDDLQERALVALMFYTGMRRSEVVALNIDSVQPSHLILPHTKYGEAQLQPLPAKAKQFLDAWVKRRLQINKETAHIHRSDKSALFVVKWGARVYRRMSVHKVYRLFREKIGVPPHSARATAATLLKLKGADDRDVAKFLRQATPGMVRIYDKRTNVDHQMATLMDY